jgi:Fe-Mn family superoxide dismutase
MIDIFRRKFLIGAGLLSSTPLIRAVLPSPALAKEINPTAKLVFPYAVPALPYSYDANEPAIDTLTMQIHHDKHHGAYVSNLNAALNDHPDLQGKTLPELLAGLNEVPEAIRTTVRNNAGGHANHTMFWQILGGKGGEPKGDLAAAIQHDLGGFDKLKADFNLAATKLFGSGWALVLVDGEGKLSLVARPNQDSPLIEGKHALFGNDVWEHAYYLKYQNRRADYVGAFWSVLDWPRISARYAAAKAGTLAV